MKLKFHSIENPPNHVTGKCPNCVWPAKKPESIWELFCELSQEFQETHSIMEVTVLI